MNLESASRMNVACVVQAHTVDESCQMPSAKASMGVITCFAGADGADADGDDVPPPIAVKKSKTSSVVALAPAMLLPLPDSESFQCTVVPNLLSVASCLV